MIIVEKSRNQDCTHWWLRDSEGSKGNAQGVTVGNDRAFCFRVMDSTDLESADALKFTLSNGVHTYSCTIEGHTLEPGKAYLLPGLNEDHPNGGLFWN